MSAKSLFQSYRCGSCTYHLPQEGVEDHWRNMDIVICGGHADILWLFRPPQADDVARCRQYHCGDVTYVMQVHIWRLWQGERFLYHMRIVHDTSGVHLQSLLPSCHVHQAARTSDPRWPNVINSIAKPDEDNKDVDHHCCSLLLRLAALLRSSCRCCKFLFVGYCLHFYYIYWSGRFLCHDKV